MSEAAERGTGRLRRWGSWLLYATTVLALLELTARAFFWISGKDIEVYRNFTTTRTPRMMVTDPVLGWRLIPGVTRNAFTSDFQLTYRTNSLGMRDAEPAGGDGYDILFLGDSQTFAEGVEIGQRFSDRVREQLPGVRTLNAGVPGYGLHQMVGSFELDGWRQRPELVVCSLIEGDVWRAVAAQVPNLGPPQVLEDPEEYRWLPEAWRHPARRVERGLRRSYVYAVFGMRAKMAWLSRQVAERDRRVWKEITGGNPTAGLPDRSAGRAGSPEEAVMRETTLRLMADLKESVRRAGAEVLIANIDDHSLLWMGPALAALDIPYADLAGSVRGIEGLHWAIDPHYNPRGHALLGAAMAAAIRERFDLARRNPGSDDAGLEARAAELRFAATALPGGSAPELRVEWQSVQAPHSLRPGARAEVQVDLRNASGSTWTSGLGRDPHYCVRLGQRWLTTEGAVFRNYGDGRVELPRDLPSGANVSLTVPIEAPQRPGRYVLQLDLVNEGVAWFESQSARSLSEIEVR